MTLPSEDISTRELLDLVPMGIMTTREGRVLSVNRCLAEWLGRTQDSMIGLTRETAPTPVLSVLFEDYELLTISGNEGEIRLRRRKVDLPADGEAYFFEDWTAWFRLEKEFNKLQEMVRSLDPRDPETGVLNREAILQALESQVIRSRRYGNPLTVIRLTLKPPENCSSPISLKSFAQELDAELRWSDQIGRSGPTSFLLILPETLLIGAEALAKKLGRDRAPLVEAEGWTLDVAVSSWHGGDDARKLLQDLNVLTEEI